MNTIYEKLASQKLDWSGNSHVAERQPDDSIQFRMVSKLQIEHVANGFSF